jgi:hypothetical protein
VPVPAPGEVITEETPDCPRSGVAHGFLVSDAADSALGAPRLVART